MSPIVDVTDTADAEDFTPIPTGVYPAIIIDVEEKNANSGDPYFKLKFEIMEGELKGRRFYDSLFFTEKSKGRMRLVTKRLGFDVDKPFNLTPGSLKGLTARMTVDVGSYTNDKGDEIAQNTIPFAGYETWTPGQESAKEATETPATSKPTPEQGDDDDLPF